MAPLLYSIGTTTGGELYPVTRNQMVSLSPRRVDGFQRERPSQLPQVIESAIAMCPS
jgi:hypothetical protein